VDIDLAMRAAVSRSMLKREDYLRCRGPLQVHRLKDRDLIRPHLDEFYAQHLARWRVKSCPSPFANPKKRIFLERFLELAADTGWIRLLRIDWKGRPLAFEFAWYFHGQHLSAPWCFAIEHANRSPGHVLLRQSLLGALEENLSVYDLGSGDQDYKLRLPHRIKHSYTWGLYP
jgi:CelD/BcsL family acetyltransferase involved in cellulose biosynthesis